MADKARARGEDVKKWFVDIEDQTFPAYSNLQQIKKKAEAESKNCHAKTMLSLEKPIKLI